MFPFRRKRRDKKEEEEEGEAQLTSAPKARRWHFYKGVPKRKGRVLPQSIVDEVVKSNEVIEEVDTQPADTSHSSSSCSDTRKEQATNDNPGAQNTTDAADSDSDHDGNSEDDISFYSLSGTQCSDTDYISARSVMSGFDDLSISSIGSATDLIESGMADNTSPDINDVYASANSFMNSFYCEAVAGPSGTEIQLDASPDTQTSDTPKRKKKKGWFKRLFKRKKKSSDDQSPPEEPDIDPCPESTDIIIIDLDDPAEVEMEPIIKARRMTRLDSTWESYLPTIIELDEPLETPPALKADKKPKKRGFLHRIFGRKRKIHPPQTSPSSQ